VSAYTSPQAASDITEEIVTVATDVVDGWYPEGRIDWEDLLERIDGTELADGSRLDMGESMMSEAITRLKREVRKYHAL
jgi:hypothetical protein